MRKTSTKTALWAIERYQEKVAFFEACIDSIEVGCAPSHIAEKPVAFYEGQIYGALATCEEILMRERSYYGFAYAAKGFKGATPFHIGDDISAHPEYAKYRVLFGTR